MILALDTSGGELVACLINAEMRVVKSRVVPGRRHQEVVLEVVEELLGTRAAVVGLSAIGVVRGPGSQTGLRVGLATAEGLAFGGRVNLLPLDSLVVAAHRSTAPGPLVAVVSAGRTNVYARAFARGPRASGTRVLCALEDVHARLGVSEPLPLSGEPQLTSRAQAMGLAVAPPRAPTEALAAAVREGIKAPGLLAYHQLTGDYGEP
jgi:tRNA threonylcarbamoyladenosine biosynthesis protein TsaB